MVNYRNYELYPFETLSYIPVTNLFVLNDWLITFIKFDKTLKHLCHQPISSQCWISYRKPSFDLQQKTIDWFLYEIKYQTEIGWTNVCSKLVKRKQQINPLPPKDAFHVEAGHATNRMTGFCMKCSTGLKLVNLMACPFFMFKVNSKDSMM